MVIIFGFGTVPVCIVYSIYFFKIVFKCKVLVGLVPLPLVNSRLSISLSQIVILKVFESLGKTRSLRVS